MKSFLPKVLFYYSAVASFFITVSLVFTSQSLVPIIFAILFLPVTAYFVIEFFKQIKSLFSKKPSEGSDLVIAPGKGEFVIMFVVFLILMGIGIRNIYIKGGAKAVNSNPPEPSSSPLIFKASPSPSPKPITTLTISITDGSPGINIRIKPTIYSDKIGEARDGDSFTYTDKKDGWYQISLPGGLTGFVSSKYVKGEGK
jgi:uncharacterized protein YgiM (DUF1202 family)